MALYDVVTASGRKITVEAPPGADNATIKQLALSQMFGPPTPPPEPETSFGGQAKEFFKGIPRGVVTGGELAATGISQLLPGEDNSGARKTISEYADRMRAPFESNPGYEESVAGKLGEGIGTTVPFLLSALAAGPVVGGGIAGALGASMGTGEAVQRAAGKGATEDELDEAGGWGVIPGLTDAIPGVAMVKRAGILRKVLGPNADAVGKDMLEKASKIALTRTGRITQAAVEEGLQEVAQGVMQNMIAQGVYDPAQGTFAGSGESLGYGAGVGGLMQALVELAIPGRSRSVAPPEEAPAPQPPSTVEQLDESIAPVDTVAPAGPVVDPTDDLNEAQDVRDTQMLERLYASENDTVAPSPMVEETPLGDISNTVATMQRDAEDRAETAEIEDLYRQDEEQEKLQTIAAIQQKDAEVEQARLQRAEAKRQAAEQPTQAQEEAPVVAEEPAAPAVGEPVEEPVPVIPSSPNEMDVEAVIPEKVTKAPVQPSLPGVPQPTTPKPTEGVLNFAPAELDALGIPPAAPVRKRIAKKDLNDPVQRGQVAVELQNFAAVAQPQVKQKIENLLATPEWRGPEPQPAPQQPEMFGPKGGVTAAARGKREPVVKAEKAEKPPVVDPGVDTTSMSEPDTTTKPAPVTAVEPETAPASDVAETLSAQELADIHELAKVEKVATADVVQAVKEKRKQPKAAAPKPAPEPVVDEEIEPAETEEPVVEETDDAVETDADVEVAEREEAEFAKVAPLTRGLKRSLAQESVDQKKRDKALEEDRQKIDALPDNHPAKKYFGKDVTVQSALTSIANDVVHKKDKAARAASEWVTSNLSEPSVKAYKNRMRNAAEEGKLLFNAAAIDGYELATPLPRPVQTLLDSGEVSATEVLEAMLPTLKGEPLRIAKALLKNVPKVKVKLTSNLKDDHSGKQVAGAYASASNTVYLDTKYGRTVHTLMHELVHAATSHMLRSPSHPAAKQLRKVFEEAKTLLPEGTYGAKSLEEFVAEAFSNPEFQAKLASMKPVGAEPNMWQRFVEAVANFIRSITGRPMLQNSTLKDQVGGLVYTIMSPAPDGQDYGMVYNAVQSGQSAVSKLFDGLYQKLPGERQDDLEVVGDYLADAGRRVVSTALDVLPMKAVVDLVKADVPAAESLYELIKRLDGARTTMYNKVRQTGYDLREKLGTDTKVHELFNDLVAESTLNNVDPSKPKSHYAGKKQDEQRAMWDKLQPQWNRLPAKAQQAYKDLRDAYSAAYQEMIKAIDTRVDQMEMGDNAKASMKKQLRQFIKEQSIEPYFPLFRRGDYWLSFNQKGKDSTEPQMMAFESIADRTRALQALRNDPDVDPSSVREFANPREYMDYSQRVPGTFTYRLMQSLGELETNALADLEKSLTARGATPVERKEAIAKLQEDHTDVRERTLKMILDAMPESAFAQQFRKRKGTEGFERDAMKVYDKRMPALANQVVNMQYAASLNAAELRIKAEVKDKGGDNRLRDYEAQLMHYIQFARNPTLPTWARIGRSLTFGMTLGTSIAPVLVNFTNLPVVVMPRLTAEYGFEQSGKAMIEAMRLYSRTGFSRNEELLVPTVNDKGETVSTRANKAGWSIDNLNYDDTTLPADLRELEPLARYMREHAELKKTSAGEVLGINNPSASVWTKINQVMGFMFHHGERLNRQVTAMAAYKLELTAMRKAGRKIDDAAMTAAAKKAVDIMEWTNGNAELATGAKASHSGLGSLLMMYKGFGISMMYHQFKMAREALKGSDARTREIAKRQIVGLYASSIMLAGISGAPLVGMMTMLADLLFLDDDDEDANTQLAKFFGEGLYSGVLNYVTGADWSSRIGMTNLIMRSQPNVEQDSWVLGAMEGLGGPVLGQLSRVEDGVKLVNDGEVWRGLERMLPSAGANMMKAWRYGTEGANTLRDDQITGEIGGNDVFMQALGFAPETYVRQLQKNAVNKRVSRNIENKATRLLRLRYMAIRQGDYDELAEVDDQIAEMNAEYPGLIPPSTLSRSLKQHMRTSEQVKKYGGVTISQRTQWIIDALNKEWE